MLVQLVRRSAPGLIVAGLLLVAVPAASAYVYWSWGSSAIGRSGLDGSAPNLKFIPQSNCTLTVGAGHVYWRTKNGLGRAKLDGSGIQSSFVHLSGRTIRTCNLAVAGNHVFFSYFRVPGGGGHRGGGGRGGRAPDAYSSAGGPVCYIARVNASGTGLKPKFIQPGSICPTRGFAVGGRYLYYLADLAGFNLKLGVARVKLSGGHPRVLLTRPLQTTENGIAVAGGHIFWDTGSHIARSDLSGKHVNTKFIPGEGGTGGQTCGLASAKGHLFWGDSSFRPDEISTVDGAKLDGTDVKHNIVNTASSTFLCVHAADGLGPLP
jgi:hypothetical protein